MRLPRLLPLLLLLALAACGSAGSASSPAIGCAALEPDARAALDRLADEGFPRQGDRCDDLPATWLRVLTRDPADVTEAADLARHCGTWQRRTWGQGVPPVGKRAHLAYFLERARHARTLARSLQRDVPPPVGASIAEAAVAEALATLRYVRALDAGRDPVRAWARLAASPTVTAALRRQVEGDGLPPVCILADPEPLVGFSRAIDEVCARHAAAGTPPSDPREVDAFLEAELALVANLGTLEPPPWGRALWRAGLDAYAHRWDDPRVLHDTARLARREMGATWAFHAFGAPACARLGA